MHALDQIDARIIEILNEDGRMPSAEIARRLGEISPRAVNYRIDALIERGLIAIKAIVNPKMLGYAVLADVLIATEPGQLRSVAHKVAELEQVTYVAGATGDRDVSIQIVARSNEELFNIVTEEIGTIPGVRRTETHLLPLKFKDIDSWLPPRTMINEIAE